MTKLYGSDRDRLGYEDQEWAVWVSGTDDIHAKNSLADALEFANELNGTFAQLRANSSSTYEPVMHAVVLHHGYAWAASTEHAHGIDCGHPQCGPCSGKRNPAPAEAGAA